MAIKGKGKTRSRRVVAAPPRPPVYVRKKPFLFRPTTIAVVAALALAAIAFGTIKALHASSERALRKRETQAIRTYSNRLTAEFPSDRQFVPPDVYFFYQSVSKDVDSFGKGKGSPALIRKEGEQMTKTAAAAADRIKAIAVDRLVSPDLTVSNEVGVRGKGMTRFQLRSATAEISRAFRIYAVAGGLVKAVSEAPPKQRAELAAQVQNLIGQGVELFSEGYRIVSGLKARVGIKTPVPKAPGAPGAPGGAPGIPTAPSG
ncbi:MAG TPA: hypothetical protein VF660_10690 [Actinomycetota bacterium]|jgi:hypothetical protein